MRCVCELDKHGQFFRLPITRQLDYRSNWWYFDFVHVGHMFGHDRADVMASTDWTLELSPPSDLSNKHERIEGTGIDGTLNPRQFGVQNQLPFLMTIAPFLGWAWLNPIAFDTGKIEVAEDPWIVAAVTVRVRTPPVPMKLATCLIAAVQDTKPLFTMK